MSSLMEWYKDIMYNKVDTRTQEFFLSSGPGPIFVILVTYVYFCLFAGPAYMKDKKPYNLKNVLIVYNFIQVLLSTYMLYEGLSAGWYGDYNIYCQPVDYTDNPKAMRMALAVHTYYICKLVELLDTVFFVLRKKNNQITALHMYHHTLMPVGSWIGIRYFPNGHGTFFGLINCFVHMIMYSYYMISSLRPSSTSIWWKKYVTLLQLTQFFLVFCHSSQIFFTDCSYPKVLAFLLSANSLIFIYMFSSFYYKTYVKNKDRSGIGKNGNDTQTLKNGITKGKTL